MKDYDVTITETLKMTVTVQAETQEEAQQMVNDGWHDGKYTLDAECFDDVDFDTTDSLSRINVLIVEPGKEPRREVIDSGLESMQGIVGGCIENAYFYEDPVAIVCNEDGKNIGLPLNRAVRDDKGEMLDIIAGTFIITGLGESCFASLPDDLMDKYEKQFKQPETFIRMGRGIMAIPIEPKKPKLENALEKKNPSVSHDAR